MGVESKLILKGIILLVREDTLNFSNNYSARMGILQCNEAIIIV